MKDAKYKQHYSAVSNKKEGEELRCKIGPTLY